ncbi:hypothetical protein KL942_001405 [Ogataea angusta]|uniref:Uncharacterized protein n=1 Tax=Pichia angusta TaxID=870730 RepID=A0ABQ7S0X2_PICAN|nr:hypothetical protein KL942_001405 [Ogataea angusta]KAG7850897.1 hypothetical protein KL940_001474 [Ogataea angusta]
MTSSSLLGSVLPLVVPFLAQQDKLNAAYASYELYAAVVPLLYRKLLFTGRPLVDSEGSWTNIGSLKNPLISDKKHSEMYTLRQELLLQTLTLNKELARCVEQVVVVDQEILQDLAQVLSRCPNLRRFEVPQPDRWLGEIYTKPLESFVVTELDQLCHLPDTVRRLKLGVLKSESLSVFDRQRALKKIYSLDALELAADEPSITTFLKFVQPFARLRLRSLSIVYYHGYNDYNHVSRTLVQQLLDKTDLATLRELEMVLGCDEMACGCLGEFCHHLVSRPFDLRRLAILQRTVHRDHNYTEKFDVAVTSLLASMPNNERLAELYIKHAPPLDAMIVHGFEGNYNKRRDLYHSTLPQLRGLERLVCPTFVWSLACYEQLMSDLLWNGCTCDHCESFLSLFDEFIMKHHYYDAASGLEKDVISPCFFSCAAATLAARFVGRPLEHLPMLDVYWNFHSLLNMDHDAGYECRFNQSFFRHLAACISHFLQDYVHEVSRTNPNLWHVNFSGIVFEKADFWVCKNEKVYRVQ